METFSVGFPHANSVGYYHRIPQIARIVTGLLVWPNHQRSTHWNSGQYASGETAANVGLSFMVLAKPSFPCVSQTAAV